MSLSATATSDLASGVTVVQLHGLLEARTLPVVRAALLKCLAECPDAVIVDLSDLRVQSRTQLAVFPAAVRHQGYPTAPVVLCGAAAELRKLMNGRIIAGLPVYADRETALAAITSAEVTGPQRVRVRIGATPGAASQARQEVTAACRAWGLDELAGPAVLIASELVSNAVEHAGTEMVLGLTRRGDFLHLCVQDGSRVPPQCRPAPTPGGPLTDRGRGLHLVDTYSCAWGCRVSADGKTVWATLRVPPDA